MFLSNARRSYMYYDILKFVYTVYIVEYNAPHSAAPKVFQSVTISKCY